MDASLDFSRLMETLRGTAGPLSSQEAFALALPDVLELNADEYADGLELAISMGVLSRLSPLNLQRLLQRADAIPVRAGEVVIEQGGRGRECYLVKHGSARIECRERNDASRELAVKGPGELLGEEALITGDSPNASVVMREDGVLLRIAAEDFSSLVLPCLQRPLTLAQAEALVERGARWLDIREQGSGLGISPAATVLPWSSFREEYRRLDDRAAWVVRADRRADAALAAFMLCLAGYEVSHLDQSEMPVLDERDTDPQIPPMPDFILGRDELPQEVALPQPAVTASQVGIAEAQAALPGDPAQETAEDECVRIGLEAVRAYERQRYQRYLCKTRERLETEADARVAEAVEITERRLLAEVHKRQQQLLELRQENARLQRELARWRGLAATPGAGWSTPRSLDII